MKTILNSEKTTDEPPRKRILFLDSMRAIAIIMVVGIHSLAYCLPLPTEQKAIISFIIDVIPVPIFFLVDGYLFALHISSPKEYDYFKHIQKSMFRLLIPWVIFTLLYLFARYYFELNGYFKEKLILGHSITEVAISAYGSVYSAQMYFLVSLFLVRLLNPIFKQITLIRHYTILLFLFACFLIAYNYLSPLINPVLEIKGGEEPITHALWGIQFYFIGIILFKTTELIKFEKLLYPFLILFSVAVIFRSDIWQWHYGNILIQYLYLISFFLLFARIGNKFSGLNIIGKNTMGIYLIHAPIILKIVSLIINKLIMFPLLNYLAIVSGTFILSMGAVMAIKRLPYGSLLFGEPRPALSSKQRKAT